MKCDFCEKPGVGYGWMQCVIYCKDHEQRGLAIEAALVEECDRAQNALNEEGGEE